MCDVCDTDVTVLPDALPRLPYRMPCADCRVPTWNAIMEPGATELTPMCGRGDRCRISALQKRLTYRRRDPRAAQWIVELHKLMGPEAFFQWLPDRLNDATREAVAS